MSVRRTIYTGQDAHRVNVEKVKSLLENLSATGQVAGRLSDTQIANLSRLLVERGISLPEVSSIVSQSTARQERIAAHILGGDTAVRYSMTIQHEVTCGQDSPDNPNFSIRFPGEAELILRRQTLGSMYMMQAAYLASNMADSAKYDCIYGKCFLSALGVEMPSMPDRDFAYAMLFSACAFACGDRRGDDQRSESNHLLREAMERAGLRFLSERERVGFTYQKVDRLYINHRDLPRPEETGCTLAARIIATHIDALEFELYTSLRSVVRGSLDYYMKTFTMEKVLMT